MHGTENEILDAFVEYKAGVVCSAEVFIWPDASLAVSSQCMIVIFPVIILSPHVHLKSHILIYWQ